MGQSLSTNNVCNEEMCFCKESKIIPYFTSKIIYIKNSTSYSNLISVATETKREVNVKYRLTDRKYKVVNRKKRRGQEIEQ
jgi:hypothetical protein